MKRLYTKPITIFSLALIILTSTIDQSNATGLPQELPGINSEISSRFVLNNNGTGTCFFILASANGFISRNLSPSILNYSDTNLIVITSSMALGNFNLLHALFLSVFGLLGFLVYVNNRARRRAKVAELRFKSLLEANPSAIMIFQNYKIRFVNSSLSDLTGYTADELLQMEVWQLIHPESFNNIENEKIKVNKKDFSFRGEFKIITRNKENIWIDLSTRSIEYEKKPAVLATAIDITERKNTEKLLKESELRYKNFFSKNSAVMLMVDPDTGDIKNANKAAVDYYGYEREKLLSMNIDQITIESLKEVRDELLKARKDHRAHHHFTHRLANGKERAVEVYTSRIKDQSKYYHYCIIFDITERRRVEQELKKAKEVAEEANRVKSFFISSVSHELRTPLNAIIGLTDLVIDANDLSEEQMENMQSIKYSSDHLLGVINDVLDLSKLEAGKVELEHTDFDLCRLVNESVKTINFKAKEKGIYINTELDPSIPPVLKGDPSRLRQVLLNLLSNAVKFTREGHIDVQVKTLSLSKEKTQIRFSVSDTGIGIPENKIERLFQSFSQAESDTSRKYGGTGLGLAISKKLVELQKGEIGVKSVEGMGSTFWFNIAYDISSSSFVPDLSKLGSREKNLQDVKILLVEDDRMNQVVMKRIIEKWNARVEIAQHGKEAVEKLERNDYDIVLMDLQMPELNGYEATRIIRDPESKVRNHTIPVLALTADVSPETRKTVSEVGMNDFITKPSDQEIMYEKIAKAISNSKVDFTEKKETGSADQAKDTIDKDKAKLRIKKALSDIFDDDIDGILALIVKFLKEIPRTIVEINESFYDKDFDTLARLVHKIKPGYSYMGFSEVTEMIHKIQELAKSQKDNAQLETMCSELDDNSREIISILREVHKEYLRNNPEKVK